MKRVWLGILGFSEIRWPNWGEINRDDHIIYYIGDDSKTVIMTIITVTIGNVNIVQVYALTQDYDYDQVKSFCSNIQVSASRKEHAVTIVMGDFNPKISINFFKPSPDTFIYIT